jgi:hypothetical protein
VAGFLTGAYVAVMIALITASGSRAVNDDDPDRRRDAYKVLRLLVGVGAAGGGLLGLLVRLHELGLLR